MSIVPSACSTSQALCADNNNAGGAAAGGAVAGGAAAAVNNNNNNSGANATLIFQSCTLADFDRLGRPVHETLSDVLDRADCAPGRQLLKSAFCAVPDNNNNGGAPVQPPPVQANGGSSQSNQGVPAANVQQVRLQACPVDTRHASE